MTQNPRTVHKKMETLAALRQERDQLRSALSKLVTLIRGMDDVYQNDAAKWLITKPSFKEAESVLAQGGQ